MISGNKSVSVAHYANAPGSYLNVQPHLRGTGHHSPQQLLQQQQQQKPNNKYSSSLGMISSTSSNMTSLSTTPQVRTRSPHAKVRGSGSLTML